MAGERGKYGDVLSTLAKYRTAAIAGTLVLALVGTMVAVKRTGSSPRAAGADTTGNPNAQAPNEPRGPTAASSVSPTNGGGSKSVAKTPYRFVTFAQAKKKGIKASFGPDCDTKTGRIKFPSVYAPPCVPLFPKGADNGGKTYQGVTKDTITVVVYIPQFNQGAEAIAQASGMGGTNDPETVQKNVEAAAGIYQHHFETYGRKVKFVYLVGSGVNTDPVAAKADAIKVATEIKAYASLFGPAGTLAYGKELAARKVVCIDCPNSLPNDFYAARAPYLWATGGGWKPGGTSWADWLGRYFWGRNAKWAGDPLGQMQQQKRKFGLVYYETPEADYKTGVDMFEKELGRYGGRIADRFPYVFDLAQAQEQARTIIAKLKNDGINNVILISDWLYPIFFTQEATRQQYFPEWGMGGLSGTNFAGRAYDQTQMAHCFMVTGFGVQLAADKTEYSKLYQWHYGQAAPTGGASCTQCPDVWVFFLGLHMAGPNLTPASFRDGLFSYPPSGGFARGGVTTFQVSYGRGVFPYDDYTGSDDQHEIWWDAQAQGPSETGQQGTGMWRHINGGRRYLPGRWPRSEPKEFDPAGTVTMYSDTPPADRPPAYPHKDDN